MRPLPEGGNYGTHADDRSAEIPPAEHPRSAASTSGHVPWGQGQWLRGRHPPLPTTASGWPRRAWRIWRRGVWPGSQGPALHLFVLEVNCSIVATTYLNVIPNITRSTSPYALIENVVVEESLRGTGLGKGNHVCHARGRM